jgi:hypothetical protein
MNNRDGESGGIQEVLRVKTGINPEESQKTLKMAMGNHFKTGIKSN